MTLYSPALISFVSLHACTNFTLNNFLVSVQKPWNSENCFGFLILSFFSHPCHPPVCVQLPRWRHFRLRCRHWLDNRTQLRCLRAPGQRGVHCAVWEHPYLSWSRYEHPGQCEWISRFDSPLVLVTIIILFAPTEFWHFNCRIFNFYLQLKFLLKHSSSVSPPSARLCLWIAVYSLHTVYRTLQLGLLYTAEQDSAHALLLSGREWSQQCQSWGWSFMLTPGFCLPYLADREVLGDSPEAEDKPVLRRPHGNPPAAQVRRPVGAEIRPLHPENPWHWCGNSYWRNSFFILVFIFGLMVNHSSEVAEPNQLNTLPLSILFRKTGTSHHLIKDKQEVPSLGPVRFVIHGLL